jgi:Ca-activated chloride channel family protein
VLATSPFAVDPPKATLEAPARAKADSDVQVRWTGPRTPSDYVSFAEPSAAADSYLTYVYTRDATAGAVQAPAQSGRYELRYIAQHAGETLILARRPIIVD